MRHRLGGVHCQTYQELFDILDQPLPSTHPHPDIDTLLHQQQLNKTHSLSHLPFFFDPLQQMQHEEEQLQLSLHSQTPTNPLITTSIVLITNQLPRLAESLLSKHFIGQTYRSIYPQNQGWKLMAEVEVNSNIASVSLSSQNLSTQIDQNAGLEVGSCGPHTPPLQQSNQTPTTCSFCGCILQTLQLVIYYNKIQAKINKNQPTTPTSSYLTCQHKIWLLNHQPTYGPLLTVYLQKAHSIFRAQFTQYPPNQLLFTPISFQEAKSMGQQWQSGEREGKRMSWGDVVRQVESVGLEERKEFRL